MSKTSKCCFVGESDTECGNDADFQIIGRESGDPYDITESCTFHVGQMLGSMEGLTENVSWLVGVIPQVATV